MFLISMYTLPQHQGLADTIFFYNINTNVKISTKKKGTQFKNEDGMNSFGVHIVKPIALIKLSLSIQNIYIDR